MSPLWRCRRQKPRLFPSAAVVVVAAAAAVFAVAAAAAPLPAAASFAAAAVAAVGGVSSAAASAASVLDADSESIPGFLPLSDRCSGVAAHRSRCNEALRCSKASNLL